MSVAKARGTKTKAKSAASGRRVPDGQASDGKSARGRARREMILNAATELFQRHGFHATGIDDIGSAVGITGPGVYRHFESKHHLLAAIVERAISLHGDIVRGVRDGRSAPVDALIELVSESARLIVENRELSGLFFQEMRNLAPEDRGRLARQQRLLITEWVDLLLQVRPELSEEEARVVVHGVGGVLNSVATYNTTMDTDRLLDLLVTTALAGMLAKRGPAARLA